MNQKLPRVCIIIPAYNEGKVIQSVAKNASKVLGGSKKYLVDIIVIDDGSTDNTAIEAKKGGAHVVSHILNSGAGGATATGLSYAKSRNYDAAATMDADGQHDPKDVLRGINELFSSSADLIIGSRLIDSSGMSKVKVAGNKGLSFITRLLFGVKSTDSQSGLRIFSRRAIESIYWVTSGYEFCSEMLWRAHQLRLNVSEYPIQAIYTNYSMGKGQNNWNAINIIKSLVGIRTMELFE